MSLYREVADETPSTESLTESLHDYNLRSIVFRVFWEDDSVFLRADLPAAPLSVGQLQVALESFDQEAAGLSAELGGLT